MLASPARATITETDIGKIYDNTSRSVVDPCPEGNTARCSTTTSLIIGTDGTDGIGDRIVTILLFIAGVAGVISILYGGIAYITAGGDDTKVSKAKSIVIYAVVTVVIATATYLIRNATVNATNTLAAHPDATNL